MQYMKMDAATEKAYLEERHKQQQRFMTKLLYVLGNHFQNNGKYETGQLTFMPEMVNFEFTGYYFCTEYPYMKFTSEYMNAHPEMFEKIK